MSNPETVTVTLGKPIEAHGETIRELTLREPTGEEFARHGMPVLFGEPMKMDTRITCNYIAKLGNLPPSAVKRMNPKDITRCWGEMLPFFLDSDDEMETSTTS